MTKKTRDGTGHNSGPEPGEQGPTQRARRPARNARHAPAATLPTNPARRGDPTPVEQDVILNVGSIIPRKSRAGGLQPHPKSGNIRWTFRMAIGRSPGARNEGHRRPAGGGA